MVDTSIGGHRMARELDILIARNGRPATIVSDNGTEMTSRAMLEWTNRTGVAAGRGQRPRRGGPERPETLITPTRANDAHPGNHGQTRKTVPTQSLSCTPKRGGAYIGVGI